MNQPVNPQFSPSIIESLLAWLHDPLPGLPAQLLMAPPHRTTELNPDVPYRHSAVLMLLYPRDNEVMLLFTKRPRTLKHHAGEICFPGGGYETEDEDLPATALRETYEEIGVPAQAITILGQLTPLYIAPSQNMVHPFVGWTESLPPLSPNEDEVAEVLQIPFRVFFDNSYLNSYIWHYQNTQRLAPCFLYQGASIWGATAMMLSELLQIVRSHQSASQVTANDRQDHIAQLRQSGS